MEHTGTGTQVVEGNTGTSTTSKTRKYCFTAYDGADAILDEAKFDYIIAGLETCPSTGREHIQGFVIWKNARTIKGLIKAFPGIHWEVCKGTTEQNITYCKKEGNFIEEGKIPPGQGNRTDIKTLAAMVRDGASDKEICNTITVNRDGAPVDMGDQFIRMHRGVKAMRDAIGWDRDEKKMCRRELHIRWGKTGTGKTRYVWDTHGINNVYKKPPSKWWSNYRGEKVIIIDEWVPHGTWEEHVGFKFLLELCDWYPMLVEEKNGSFYLPAEKIYITSNYDPKEWFKHAPPESQAAFMRRCDSITEVK